MDDGSVRKQSAVIPSIWSLVGAQTGTVCLQAYTCARLNRNGSELLFIAINYAKYF